MNLIPSYFTVQIAFAPLPLPFMRALREIEIETAIGQASIFRLHFDLSRNFMGDFDALALDIFRPMFPITIRMSIGLGLPLALINGYIKDASVRVSNDPGASTLEVVGMDALGTLMAHVEQAMPWPNMPDNGVVLAIFAKYGMTPLAFPTPPTRTMVTTTTTQRGTDAGLLLQLAHTHSYEVYVQPDPLSGLDVGHFHPALVFPISQGVLSIDFGTQTKLLSFNVSYDMLNPRAVFNMTADPVTRAPMMAFAMASTDLPLGREPTLNRILPPPIEVDYTSWVANPAEAQLSAFARTTSSSRSIRASGEVDGIKFKRPLMVGLPVLVRGAGQTHSGLYYVTSVTHRISRDNYTQSFSAWRNAVGLTGAEVFIDPLAPAG